MEVMVAWMDGRAWGLVLAVDGGLGWAACVGVDSKIRARVRKMNTLSGVIGTHGCTS
jgi:hypothetical protein